MTCVLLLPCTGVFEKDMCVAVVAFPAHRAWEWGADHHPARSWSSSPFQIWNFSFYFLTISTQLCVQLGGAHLWGLGNADAPPKQIFFQCREWVQMASRRHTTPK